MNTDALLFVLAVGWPVFWLAAVFIAEHLTGPRLDPFGWPCNSRPTNFCIFCLTVGTVIVWACLVAFHLGRHAGGVA